MAEENRLFQVEIITPDRVFYTGEGDMIEFTTASGEIGVYKKHIPLTTVLAPGIVKIHKTGEDDVIAAVHSGFAEILPDKVWDKNLCTFLARLTTSLPVWMENMFRLQRQSADLRRFLKESMMMYRRVIS